MRNVDGSFNKEGPIENMVEVNIYYQRHRERTEMEGDFGDTMVSTPQFRDRLENRGG